MSVGRHDMGVGRNGRGLGRNDGRFGGNDRPDCVRKLARRGGIRALDLAPTSEMLEALEGIDPERIEDKISGRFV